MKSMIIHYNTNLTPWAIAFDVISLLLMLIWAINGVYVDHTNGEPPP